MSRTVEMVSITAGIRLSRTLVALVVATFAFASPVAAVAYSAKTESADEEYVEKRATEAVAQAQAEARRKEEEQASSANGTIKPEQKVGTSGSASRETTEADAGPSCLVPELVGDSIKKAREALHKHHCQLGRVRDTHGHHRGPLVVVGQQRAGGKELHAGARVGVSVGPARVRKHH